MNLTDTYTKLFSSITASTIWLEPDGTRLTWITMLAMADRNGCVYASVPGLADRAKVSRDAAEKALSCFTAPDPDSRTKDFEGRRIEAIDGGWRLLNHRKFREMRSAEERREYMRNYMQEKRALAKTLAPLALSTEVTPPAPAPAPYKEQEQGKNPLSPDGDPAPCPVAEIVKLYHEILPELPECLKITSARRSSIQQRWREDLTDLDDWRLYFENIVRPSAFLMGRRPATNGRPVFRADIGWLTNPTNYAKIIEGKYNG